MTTTVDARGLSCPQPVILTRNAMQKVGKGRIEVLVETGTSRDNVSRLARKEGWQVEVTEVEGGFKLALNK
ncbi:MAG: sulfurtransferase TusA family protein [Chloroflexota bacterium]